MARRVYPEDAIQRALFQHIRTRGQPGLVAFHVPNGAKLGGARTAKGIAIQGARFKGLGVRAGASDIIGLYRGHAYALEVKAPGNVPTEAQLQFLHDFEAAGGYAAWAQGLDRCLAILEAWGWLRGTTLGAGNAELERATM